MNETSLKGVVVRGRGLASCKVGDLPQQVLDYLGGNPVPGTANVILERPVRLRCDGILGSVGLHSYWPSEIQGDPVIIDRWPGCPLHVLEVISTKRIRDSAFPRERISIDLGQSHVPVIIGSKEWLAWACAWLGRRSWYYRSDQYVVFTKWLARKWIPATQGRCV